MKKLTLCLSAGVVLALSAAATAQQAPAPQVNIPPGVFYKGQQQNQWLARDLILGAKVRALAEGRYNVSVEDLKALAAPALRHRVILNFEGEAEGVDVDNLISQVVDGVEATAARSKEPFLR